jgi:hypothetical protein
VIYGALWRALPGPRPVRVVQAVVLVLAAVVFCLLWLFPRIAPHMPFNETTVEVPSAPQVSATTAPPGS